MEKTNLNITTKDLKNYDKLCEIEAAILRGNELIDFNEPLWHLLKHLTQKNTQIKIGYDQIGTQVLWSRRQPLTVEPEPLSFFVPVLRQKHHLSSITASTRYSLNSFALHSSDVL